MAIDYLNSASINRPKKSHVTVDMVRQHVLDGIPVYLSGEAIPDHMIQFNIWSAEDQVEKDSDLLIGPRDIHCIQDQSEPVFKDGIDDFRIIKNALDKPRNWFAGDRRGAIKLPLGPAKIVKSVSIALPYSTNARFAIRLDSVRLEKQLMRFMPARYGYMFQGTSGPWGPWSIFDSSAVPGGIEVIYQAGLSERQIQQDWMEIPAMVVTLAALRTLLATQARLGGGIQRESITQDNLVNMVELADRSHGGPLAGEIAGLARQYNEMLRALNAKKMFFGWLG